MTFIERMPALAPILTMAIALSATATAKPVVEGYLPSNRGLDTTLTAAGVAPYTDIALAFINPDTNGAFVSGDALACMTDRMLTPIPTATLASAVATIHAAHARAIGALAGAVKPACAGDWATLAAPTQRAATVAALVAFADEYELDGLDVDIEGDLLAGMVKSGDYIPFVSDLSRALHAHHKTLYGTTASYVGGMIPLGALSEFDRVEVMSYDNKVPGEEHASMAKFRSDLYLWLGRGVPKTKLVMGLPFYGWGYGTYNPSYPYHDLVAQFGPQAGDLIGQICATCSYVTFNGPATIEEKTALATAKAGGVMVWEISDDTPDAVLAKAITAGLKAPPPAPAASGVQRPSGIVIGPAWTVFGTTTYAPLPQSELSGRAIEVEVAKPTENSWDVGVTVPLGLGVKAGDRLTFAVQARLKAADPDTQLEVPMVVEDTTAPNAPVLQGKATVTTQWQWLVITGVAVADHADRTLKVGLQIGDAAKTIDLGRPYFVDSGPSPAP